MILERMRCGAAVSLLSVLVVVGCKNNATETKWQYMPDMADAPAVKSQLNYLLPPEHSVAYQGVLYPPDEELEMWEKRFHNPYVGHPKEDIYRAEGAKLFAFNCVPCHGADGKGEGTVTDEFPKPPSIVNELNLQRPDGFFFHKITVGGPLMPSRAEDTYPHERWKIILHLRRLQEKYASE
ncbi:MAG: c-type cytochrome [Zetaproteobacteria bacterium]|nr:c-type cytochrome [Zetaproteobacteria bacterium]